MSPWLRAGLAILALLLLCAGVILMLRARVEESPALREALVAAARAQLGVGLEPGEIRLGLRDGALHLAGPVVHLDDGARLALGETRIVVDPVSLLAGRPRVRGVETTGTARLEAAPSGARDPARAFTLSGELTLVLREPDGQPAWSLEGTARPGSGGSLEIHGRVDAGGFAGEVVLDDVESAPFAPLLESEHSATPTLSGAYDGTLELAADAPRVLRLASRRARVGIPPLSLEGPVALVAWLPGRAADGEEPGRLRIDASGARVEYAGTRVHASGSGASVWARILRGADGRLRLDGVELHVEGFSGELDAPGPVKRR